MESMESDTALACRWEAAMAHERGKMIKLIN
jgi:hypothetical protein